MFEAEWQGVSWGVAGLHLVGSLRPEQGLSFILQEAGAFGGPESRMQACCDDRWWLQSLPREKMEWVD